MARVWRDNKLFGMVMGPSGKQLAESWGGSRSAAGSSPKCEFGFIAQATGVQYPLLPGDDDWVVSVAETKLEGAKILRRSPIIMANCWEMSACMTQ